MKKRRILIVDDDRTVLAIITDLLGQQGYDVFGAASIAEAMWLFEKHREEIALAMIDIVLDNESGFDLANAIEKAFDFNSFVFFTAYFWQETIMEELKRREAVFFEKPLKFQKEVLPFLENYFETEEE
jgi:DNA-binding NtrC family response regulator